MEDRDPIVALQACIAAVRRSGGVGEEDETTAIVRSLCRVGEALSERERELEWLREALEQSRESYEERSRALEQMAAQMAEVQQLAAAAGKVVGVASESGGAATRGLEWQNEGTEVASSEYGMTAGEGGREDQQECPPQQRQTAPPPVDGKDGDEERQSGGEEDNLQSLPKQQNSPKTDSQTLPTPQELTDEEEEEETVEPPSTGATGENEETGVGGVANQEVGVVNQGDSGVLEAEGYKKVELYYHTATGYYYDQITQQFYSPVNNTNQTTEQSNPSTGQPDKNPDDDKTEQASTTYESGPSGPTPKQPKTVTELLAAVSEQASQKCGLSYDEASGMYYDHGYAMYYDQKTQLYYDPEGGTYYEYDPVTCQYQVHSRVKLPKKKKKQEEGLEKIVDLCSSSDSDGEGSLEDGELVSQTFPDGSPPPEEDWAPCLRLVAVNSDCVQRGTVYVVTQEGAQIGREPGGLNPIALKEVQVSKVHVDVRFSRTNGCFTICDLASQNGTLHNNERISEPKTQSKPRPLNHNDTLTIGSTLFTLHIHSGWDTCEFCRWEERVGGGGGGGGEEEKDQVSWKSELNRIKKRYGLRLKDTFGEDPVRAPDGYTDRAAGRRKKVGIDMPETAYPDTPPASVHRAITEDSVGHKMLRKLGWKKGEGLGKDGNKGRTEPVTAELREARSGLGSAAGGGGGGTGKRALDAAGSETAAKHARLVKHFSEVVARESGRSKKRQ